jgi:hypothetical protein
LTFTFTEGDRMIAVLPPSPDPAPLNPAHGRPLLVAKRVAYQAYWYWTKDKRDDAPVLCRVPVGGPRVCVRFSPLP